MTKEKLEILVKLQKHIEDVQKFMDEYDTLKQGTDAGAEPVMLRLTAHRAGHDYASVTLNSKFNICCSITDDLRKYLNELKADFEKG